MFKKISVFVSILFFFFMSSVYATETLKVITNCHEFFINPYCEKFTEKTGVEVKVNYIHNKIVSRIELKPTESDIIITKTPFILPLFEEKGYIEPLKKYGIEKEGYWVEYAYKLRVIYGSKDRLNIDTLDYMDLSNEKWKGLISIRSGYDEYNLQLFSCLYLDYGRADFISFIKSLKKNLNHPPRSNDRFQISSICKDEADLAIASSHYRGIMNNNPSQKDCVNTTKIMIPNDGVYKFPTCVAITKSVKSKKNVKIFIDGLFTDESQELVSKVAFEYPINKKFISKEVLSFTDGKSIKIKNIDIKRLSTIREKVVDLLDYIDFDN